jgi:hypothetical protein
MECARSRLVPAGSGSEKWSAGRTVNGKNGLRSTPGQWSTGGQRAVGCLTDVVENAACPAKVKGVAVQRHTPLAGAGHRHAVVLKREEDRSKDRLSAYARTDPGDMRAACCGLGVCEAPQSPRSSGAGSS